MFRNEFIEQRKAYLEQADAVARELGKLTSVSVRTLGYLAETESDTKLLDTVQRKANEILALQHQLRELWDRPWLSPRSVCRVRPKMDGP